MKAWSSVGDFFIRFDTVSKKEEVLYKFLTEA
jgi:hypothetical protein